MANAAGGRASLHPAQVLVLGFLAAIAVGTLLLTLPIAIEPGGRPSLVTALFTATSAVCVTGLVVVDTATHWSTFGEVVIMLLIQIGGLGIMTMSTLVAIAIGRRITMRERLVIQEALGQMTLAGLVRLTKYILLITFMFESLGAVVFTLRWAADYPLGRALYYGVFHSVSAFNNAGFDLFSTSFEGFVADPTVNIMGMFLIVTGGLGFVVMADIYRRLVERGNSYRMSLHSRIVLTTSAALVGVSTLLIFLWERTNPGTLANLPWSGKLLGSFFTAVTPRTAGFNTLPTGSLRPVSLLYITVLMFIGGSPGSTAGGIKTTTFGALLAAVYATVTGKDEIQLFRRRLARDVVDKGLAIAMIALVLVISVTMVLLATEEAPLMDTLFETMSAFGTVGLTTGLTPYLSTAGRLLIVATMFAGRVGPLTLAVAITRERQEGRYRHPEERIMVG